MFRELLEAVIKCMIVFQELNFDPVKEILKIRCHIYILIKKVIILREIHVKLKSFARPEVFCVKKRSLKCNIHRKLLCQRKHL